jgi:aminoglycoside phosphotransferase (APT) family kinase protein
MHSDQVQIDATIARAAISSQFPEYSCTPVEQVGTVGTVNAIFRIGTSVAARFPLRMMDTSESADMLHSEMLAMKAFAEHSPFATPRPIAIGRPTSRYPMHWSLQSWIDGDVATPDGLAASNAFALDIAHLIATLRTVDTKGQTFDRSGRGGNLADHDDWMDVCFKNSEHLLDVPRLRSKWDRLRLLPKIDPDVMNHGDLIPANLLVQGERLVGVLDCGSFGPADPALDLIAFWHLFDSERREIARARLQSTPVEWKRGAAWAFQQAMGLVWYYRCSNPAMSDLGRSTLARIMNAQEI